MLDEARPDDRPADRTQAQPRDRAKPAERTKAAREPQASDKPVNASQGNAAGTVDNENAAVAGQIASEASETVLAPDTIGTIVPADGIGDETSGTTVTDATASEAPAVPQIIVLGQPSSPAAPIAVIPAVTADTSQAAPDAPSQDALPISAQPATAAPETAAAMPAPVTGQAPAGDVPPAGADATPEPAQAQAEQEEQAANGANAAQAARPATPSNTQDAVKAADRPGKDKTRLAETDISSSGKADMNADAAPPENPKQSKPAQPQPDTKADKAAPQADVAAASDDAPGSTPSGIDLSAQSAQTPNAGPVHAASTHAATTHATTAQAAPVSAAQPIPVNAVAVEIAAQARAGNSRFEIRLDPPELGRIDVRLDIDNDGNVRSRLIIERTDTYDLLRRDQSTLERALQQAGLKTSDNALEFSLRDQGFAQHRDNEDQPRGVKAMIGEADIAPSEAANGYARLLAARGGLDIRV